MHNAIVVTVLVVVALLGVGWWLWQQQSEPVVTSFEECAAAGYPVMESYPARCQTPNGQMFTQDIGNELEKSDIIRLESPRPGETVGHTLTVRGEARGTWFFEASFPVHVQTTAGEIIASAPAQAEGEWMTEEFIPFMAQLNIPASVTGDVELVLEKSNPSGLPEHADELRVPITVE